MAKNKLLEIWMWLVGIIVSIAIGGFFISGGFMNVLILKMLPLIVHQVVGWTILITTAVAVILKIVK